MTYWTTLFWRQEMLLQDNTSKIEKLQQLLHSERQRMELATDWSSFGMRLPPLFPESVAGLASAADPWRDARRACQSNQSEKNNIAKKYLSLGKSDVWRYSISLVLSSIVCDCV